MSKKRKPLQYVQTSKTGTAAYDPNTGTYLPQQYLPEVTVTADRYLPFQNGKFAPWLAAKGLTENDPLSDPIAMAAGATAAGLRLGSYGASQIPRMFGRNLASEASSGLTDAAKIMTPKELKNFLGEASKRAEAQFMTQARGMFNRGPVGKFGKYADIRRDQIERGRLAELTGAENNPDYWNQTRTPEYPVDRFNTKAIANRGMDYYIRGDVSPIPSLNNRWLTQGDPGDVVREMGRTSYAKDIPEADQYLAWQNWEAAKNNLEIPPNVRLPIHDIRDRIVRNMDTRTFNDLNSNIRRMPLGRGPETLNSTSDFTPTLKPGFYSVETNDVFQSGNLGPNSFVTNADVPTTPTASQFNMLPKSIYDFRKPINTQINIADELGKGSYSVKGINPSPLVNNPNYILKGSNTKHVKDTMMTGAEEAFNSPDFAKEYVQAYDPYRQGFDIAPSMGVKVPENENDIMLELMPRIKGDNLNSTRGITPAGRPFKIMSRDKAFERLSNADIKRFGNQTNILDKDFYFDALGDNIMYTPDGRLHHIDMFPKLAGLKKRYYGRDVDPIMNSYKGAVLDKLTSLMPYYKDVLKDIETGKITKDMADKMLETSMRIGNEFIESAKLGSMDVDFNTSPKSLFAFGVKGLKKFGKGGAIKDIGLALVDNIASSVNKDFISDDMYNNKNFGNIIGKIGSFQSAVAPIIASAVGGPAASMAVSGAQQLSNSLVPTTNEYMASGGALMGNRTPMPFIEYQGPKHSEGGIAVDQAGYPTHPSMASAEVEGGETSYKAYVYSDRLKDPKTGKTFADASKAITRRYGQLNDDLSIKAYEREMSRLMASNEEIRISKEMNSYKRSLKKFLPKKDWGGLTNSQWMQAGVQNAGNIANLAYNIFSKPQKFPDFRNRYASQIEAPADQLDPSSELSRANDSYIGLRRALPGMTGGQSSSLGALQIAASRGKAVTDAGIYDRYNQMNMGLRERHLSRLAQLGEADRAANQWSFQGNMQSRANRDNQIFANVNAIGANMGNMFNQAAWNQVIGGNRWSDWRPQPSLSVDPQGNWSSMRPGFYGPAQQQELLPQEQVAPYVPLPQRALNLNPYPSPRPPYYPPYEDNLAPWATQAGPRLFKKGGKLYGC